MLFLTFFLKTNIMARWYVTPTYLRLKGVSSLEKALFVEMMAVISSYFGCISSNLTPNTDP